jgi:hypothetical protein
VKLMSGLIITLAVILGLIPAEIARRKGHSFLGYWIFGVLLWIIALPAALILKPTYQCPHCMEAINPAASRCPHCHGAVTPLLSLPK